jgi:hypothetical protein
MSLSMAPLKVLVNMRRPAGRDAFGQRSPYEYGIRTVLRMG